MSGKYYYAINGVQQGPVALDILRQLAVEQEFKRSDLVWKKGMASWEKAGTVKEIFMGLPPDINKKPDDNFYIPLPDLDNATVIRLKSSGSRALVLIGVFISIILIWTGFHLKAVKDERDEDKKRETSYLRFQAEQKDRNAEKNASAYNEGHDRGYLFGISEARQGNYGAISQHSVSESVDYVQRLFKSQGKPIYTDEEKASFVRGFVQGCSDGQRKVYIDGK